MNKNVPMKVPAGAVYKTYTSIAIEGTGWALASNYEFFKTDEPVDGTANYAEKGELEKNSAVTIFGINLLINSANLVNTAGSNQALILLHYYLSALGYLEFRFGKNAFLEVPSCLIPQGNGQIIDAATLAQAIAADDESIHINNGHPHVNNVWMPDGGILVKPGSDFSIRQQFFPNTNGTAPLTGINAAASIANLLVYGVVLHAYVHEPDQIVGAACGLIAASGSHLTVAS